MTVQHTFLPLAKQLFNTMLIVSFLLSYINEMLKLFTLFKLENLKQVVGRFPLPVVLIVIVSLLFFLLNNWNLSYDSPTLEMLQKGITTLILMFFLSI